MVVGLVLDREGWPLSCQVWPGNTADVSTLLPVVARMRERFQVRRVSIVSDRGMISAGTIAALETKELDCDYILGARMRSVKEVREKVLTDRSPFLEVTPERQTSRDPSPLKVKEIFVEGRRYVICLNEEQRRKDAADRKAIVKHLRQQLQRGDKDLIGNKGYRKFVRLTRGEHFVIDEEKIKEEALYDGKWVLQTSLADKPQQIALAYKELWMVEDMFRTMKSVLETRPIYHKRDEPFAGMSFAAFWLCCSAGPWSTTWRKRAKAGSGLKSCAAWITFRRSRRCFRANTSSCAARSLARRIKPFARRG